MAKIGTFPPETKQSPPDMKIADAAGCTNLGDRVIRLRPSDIDAALERM